MNIIADLSQKALEDDYLKKIFYKAEKINAHEFSFLIFSFIFSLKSELGKHLSSLGTVISYPIKIPNASSTS
jgi:hypothetical protein